MMMDPSINHLLLDVKLYARDAGTDFVESHLGLIMHQAVAMAECRSASLDILAYGFGRAAIEDMTRTLLDLTAMKAEADGSMIRLIRAEPTPLLV